MGRPHWQRRFLETAPCPKHVCFAGVPARAPAPPPVRDLYLFSLLLYSQHPEQCLTGQTPVHFTGRIFVKAPILVIRG